MTRWNASTKTLVCAALVALVGLSGNANEHDGFTSEGYCDDLAARDEERQANFGKVLCANADEIAENEQGIAANKMMGEENRAMIASNDDDIAANRLMGEENRAMIASNDEDIAANQQGIAANKLMGEENRAMIMSNDVDIAANVARLDMHQAMIGDNGQRLDAHAASLARHDQMLSSHASLIDGNTKSIQMLDERVNQVAAMAAALSAVPNAPSTGEQFFIGVGVGNHSGESSLAVGLSGRVGPNQNILINAGVANSSGETTVRAGVGWAF